MLSTKASATRIPLLSLCHIRLHQGSIRLVAACALFSSRLGQMCSVRVTFIYILGIVGSIALITGCVLLPLGLVQQAEASSADPSTEFASVGTCEITHVLHRAEDRQEGGGSKQHQGSVCWDIYIYKFEYQGQTYQSKEEWVRRGGERCENSAQRAGLFSTGQDTPCWQATGDVSSLYSFGNDAGLKIFDPAQEIEDAAQTAVALIIAGAMLLPMSLLFLPVAAALYRCGGCNCNK